MNEYVKAIYEQRDKEIYKMHLSGLSYSKIKEKYGIDGALISRIVHREKVKEEKVGDLTSVNN